MYTSRIKDCFQSIVSYPISFGFRQFTKNCLNSSKFGLLTQNRKLSFNSTNLNEN